MLIQFFKNNNPFAFIFLPLLTLVLWINGFVLPQNTQTKELIPLFDFFGKIPFYTSFILPFLALVFVLIEAFLLNFIANKYEILPKSSFLPALLYIILMSIDNSMLTLRAPVIANFLILLIVLVFLESYRKDSAFSNAFDVGALSSIATLFYPPTIVLLPILGIGLLVMRPFNWRDWIICLIGIFTPYLFVCAYYFLNGQLESLGIISFFYSNFSHPINPSSALISIFGIVSLIILLSLGDVSNNLRGGSQKKSKSTLLFIWIALFSPFSLYMLSSISFSSFSLFIIPASIFCALYLSNVKKKWWGEFLFAILFISVIVNLMSVYF
jgi:hypothetical protein